MTPGGSVCASIGAPEDSWILTFVSEIEIWIYTNKKQIIQHRIKQILKKIKENRSKLDEHEYENIKVTFKYKCTEE